MHFMFTQFKNGTRSFNRVHFIWTVADGCKSAMDGVVHVDSLPDHLPGGVESVEVQKSSKHKVIRVAPSKKQSRGSPSRVVPSEVVPFHVDSFSSPSICSVPILNVRQASDTRCHKRVFIREYFLTGIHKRTMRRTSTQGRLENLASELDIMGVRLGRPNIDDILRRAMGLSKSKRVAVLSCGPVGMMKAVQRESRKHGCEVHTETFGF